MVGMRHGDWVEELIEEMNDAMTTTVSFTGAAAERERALQAENERLREENQYLNDLYEANEFGIVQEAWEAEVEWLRERVYDLEDMVVFCHVKAYRRKHGAMPNKEWVRKEFARIDAILNYEPHGATQESE